MGYAYMIGECFGCKQTFSFNPNKVPSIRIEGVKQPVCEVCIEKANPKRKANGLEPIEILPGAYEPCNESELL